MDIAAPGIEQRVAPAPHWLRAQRTDRRRLIHELAREHPDATPDEIAAMCVGWGLPVSGVLAARLVQEARRDQSPARA